MQEMLLKFDLCSLVVIDDGTSFKAVFAIACDALRLPFECAARCNIKSLLVEI